MKYLQFSINNMAITRTNSDKTTPISGSIGYFGVRFEMDEEFISLAGIKAVEFYKNRKVIKSDLINGSCEIPNEMLGDKTSFDMRVVSGNMVATPWIPIAVTESGAIQAELPEEDLPDTMGYVKTLVGDKAVALLRKGDSGLEYSQNGDEWESGISGIPDVPKLPKDAIYLRKNGDWMQYENPKEGLIGTATAISELALDADLASVIAKVNEIIGVLKDRGVSI